MTTAITVPATLGFAAVLLSAGVAYAAPNWDTLDVDLTDVQIEALETAHEMRADGSDRAEIKAFLEDEGLDRETLREVKSAVRAERQAAREAVKATVADADYDAFLAVAPDKLTENITSEADFDQLVEAYQLKEAGDREGAKEIMSDLGFEKPDGKRGFGQRGERGN